MNREVVVTCAVTGSGDSVGKHPAIPVTPEQIAAAAIEAAKAGAAVAHIHVRDPATGKAARRLELYREVVERVRDSGVDVILNLTAGMRGDYVPDQNEPWRGGAGTDMASVDDRLVHVEELKPEICTLDLNTMNSGAEVVINTPGNVRRMAKAIAAAGVRPEIELFDSGDIALLHDLLEDGTLSSPPLCSFVMGVRYGFQPSPETVLYARNLLPADATFTAIGIGRASFPTVALSYLAGGHVRVGLEDGVYLARGALAPSNAALVEKARRIVEDLGGQVATPAEARDILGLPA